LRLSCHYCADGELVFCMRSAREETNMVGTRLGMHI